MRLIAEELTDVQFLTEEKEGKKGEEGKEGKEGKGEKKKKRQGICFQRFDV